MSNVCSFSNIFYEIWCQKQFKNYNYFIFLGPVVGEILEDIIPMIATNLNPEKDPEVRLKFFSLLSRLMMNAPNTLDSQQRFSDFAVVVIKDMIIPNCVWKAGRVAGAIRTTAVSCMWALLQSGILLKEKVYFYYGCLEITFRMCFIVHCSLWVI